LPETNDQLVAFGRGVNGFAQVKPEGVETAGRLLAGDVRVLLATQAARQSERTGSVADDVLETCLYLLRDRLQGTENVDG
jgi:hypothetical protein